MPLQSKHNSDQVKLLRTGAGADKSRQCVARNNTQGKAVISCNCTEYQERAILKVAYLHPYPVSVNSSCGQSNCCNKKLQNCQALQNEMSIYVEVSVSDSQKTSHCKGLGEIIWRGAGGICSGTQLTRICTNNHACAETGPANANTPSRFKGDGSCWCYLTPKQSPSVCVTACRSA